MRRMAIPLWASAFVIAALLMSEAAQLPAHRAHAQMAVSGRGGFTLVTAPSGGGNPANPASQGEFLYVLDARNELLYLYEIPDANNRRILFRSGVYLPNVFAVGRGGG